MKHHNKISKTENKDISMDTYFKNQQQQPKQIKKNKILQMPGSIATKAYYVKSGLLRSYTIDDNGKIHIFMFAPEGWVISDIESHTMALPTDLFIDALEDSEVLEFHEISRDRDSFLNKDNIQKLFRRIATLQRRVILLMSASAKQRYEHFLDTYPQLLNRVPQKK